MSFLTPTILVADDELSARNLLRKRLDTEGYEVLLASDGQQALEIYQERRPDAVLLDLMMPNIDGVEACRQIQNFDPNVRIPILMITAKDDKETIQEIFDAGASDYLRKPVDWIILKHRLQYILEDYYTRVVLQKRNMELETLNQLSTNTLGKLDLNTILEDILRVGAKAIDATSGYIGLVDLESDRLTIAACYTSENASEAEKATELGKVYRIVQEFEGLREWLLAPADRYTAQVDDPNGNAAERAYMQKFGVQSALNMPFYVQGEPICFLDLWESRYKREFTAHEIQLVQSIANQAGAAIANAKLYESLRESEQKLVENNKRLAATNTELGSFSHSIAHDLKTPLGTITNYAGMIPYKYIDQVPSEVITYALRIEETASRMGQMIDRLLYIGRLRDAHATMKPVAIQHLVHVVMRQYKQVVEAQEIQVHVAEDLPQIMGHEVWVEQVFANLIGNAIKYMGESNGTPEIRVTSQPLPDNANMIRFDIQDNGMGIAPENQEKLFQMFTRFHQESADGFGLGLSIVKRVIHKMQGDLGVESAIGQGSTFWFTLPVATS